MKSTMTVLLLVLFCLPVHAVAESADVTSAVKKLEQAYISLQDMQASFRQKTSSGSVAVVQEAVGRVYFKKQGKMLWKYDAPEEQLIVLDGKTLWFYLPAEKQAMKNNFSVIPRHIVTDLFRGQMDVLGKFKAAFVPRDSETPDGHIAIELVPLEPDPTVAKLVLLIGQNDYLVRRTELTDMFGNRTELVFKDISIDRGLDDSLFEFVPPPDVDIFEPPQQ